MIKPIYDATIHEFTVGKKIYQVKFTHRYVDTGYDVVMSEVTKMGCFIFWVGQTNLIASKPSKTRAYLLLKITLNYKSGQTGGQMDKFCPPDYQIVKQITGQTNCS